MLVLGRFSRSLSTVPVVFYLGAPQCLAVFTSAPSLAGNPCRTTAGTWVYSQCSVPLLAIINSSRWLLAFVLGYGSISGFHSCSL